MQIFGTGVLNGAFERGSPMSWNQPASSKEFKDPKRHTKVIPLRKRPSPTFLEEIRTGIKGPDPCFKMTRHPQDLAPGSPRFDTRPGRRLGAAMVHAPVQAKARSQAAIAALKHLTLDVRSWRAPQKHEDFTKKHQKSTSKANHQGH